MTDAIEQETAAGVGSEPTAEQTPKPVKAPRVPRACHCQTYEVADPKDADSVFATGCTQTTGATFAQGHDARLVSFLVDGYFDGYQIRQALPGETSSTTVVHDTPADAVKAVSEALAEKANKATLNRKAQRDGVAERKAARDALKAKKLADKEAAAKAREAAKAEAKAAGPKATGAEVVAGSVTGDVAPLEAGQARIKVGKFEYAAEVDDEGNATYVDGAGDKQTVNRDGYRLLAV